MTEEIDPIKAITKDEVFKLIEDNGLTLHGDIEHFAHLVAEHEREACAKEAEKTFYSVQAAENIRARGQE